MNVSTTNLHGVASINVGALRALGSCGCNTRKISFTMKDGSLYEITAFTDDSLPQTLIVESNITEPLPEVTEQQPEFA